MQIKRLNQERELLEQQQKEQDRQRMMKVGEAQKSDMENKNRLM